MPDSVVTAEGILKDQARMTPDDQFTFHCASNLDCFTACCRDVSIVLTPYDILRLKNALRMGSTNFLEEHTLPLLGAQQKFPLTILRMDPETKQCPFVTAQGCQVYADRPWACRMYPLGVAKPKNPTPADQPFYFVLHEELCHGHRHEKLRSVREWIAEQGIEEYEMMGAPFQELVLHDFWNRKPALAPQQAEMFYMACYDLDRFRRFVFESRFLELFEIDEARVEALRSDDEELLEFAMLWLRFSLFGEKTMKIRREVVEARKHDPSQGSTMVAPGSAV
ncbi:MAG: YkgJ family cysteine cluster protein [Terriglobia bacterium]